MVSFNRNGRLLVLHAPKHPLKTALAPPQLVLDLTKDHRATKQGCHIPKDKKEKTDTSYPVLRCEHVLLHSEVKLKAFDSHIFAK